MGKDEYTKASSDTIAEPQLIFERLLRVQSETSVGEQIFIRQEGDFR